MSVGKAKSSFTLGVYGFDDLLKRIEDAGGSAERAAEMAIKADAQIATIYLTAEARKAGLPDKLIHEIDYKLYAKNGLYEAEVGWEKGVYDARNPSDAYKVIFMNYGTVRRKTRKGYNRGSLETKNFILKAKRKADRQAKRENLKILESIERHFKGGGK